jgi:RimJ/RimL family protein N-acetyltransferase
MTPAFLRASLEGNIRGAERAIGMSLPPEWPEDSSGVLSLRLQQIEADPTFQPWSLRAMALRSHRTMVGHIGFHARPGADYLRPYSPTGVEFGFTVFTPFRRRGYAREASQALMGWAHQIHGIEQFILTVRPDNTASQNLASRLGFVRIGSHMDDVDGLEDILLCDVSRQMRLA